MLAAVFKLPPENVRVLAPHTGGGFGCKGYVWPHELIAAAAAKVVGRPVKLVMTRADMYANVGYQPETHQQIMLAADADGHLLAVAHDSTNITAIDQDYVEFSTAATRGAYAAPAMRLSQNVRRVNVNIPTPMRAAHEGRGMWALESAMDELAHALGLDPLELRLRNFAEVDPVSGKPWSSNKLRQAYHEGARLFDWWERSRAPVRDGDWILGTGMAACAMSTFRFPAQARVRLRADGSAVVETSTHDIGTGTYTIFPQIAADVRGIDPARVALRAGDTDLPPAGPVYGSSSTMGTGAAVMQAAERARAELGRLTNRPPGESIGDAMRRAGRGEIVADGAFVLPGNAFFDDSGHATPYAMRTFGAIFVEVAVDPELGLMRLRRVVGSYSAGRIINPRTARSQMTGGIIWGWGMAAMEASLHEPRLGRWLSKNLSGVAVPVNSDIPDITIHFVDEFDPHASPLGARGIGELGATGVAAAVGNAVFHATGRLCATCQSFPRRWCSEYANSFNSWSAPAASDRRLTALAQTLRNPYGAYRQPRRRPLQYPAVWAGAQRRRIRSSDRSSTVALKMNQKGDCHEGIGLRCGVWFGCGACNCRGASRLGLPGRPARRTAAG